MLRRGRARLAFGAVVGAILFSVGTVANASPILGGGADGGGACPSSLLGSCTASYNYEITSVWPATGSIDDSALLSVSVTSLIMTAVSGNTNEVQKIAFSNLQYTYSGSPIAGFGLVEGTYEQRRSDDTVVVADTAFSEGALFSSVSCDTAQCGFFVGANFFTLDVDLDGGTTEHAFRHMFNVFIPDPSTALLLSSGLALLAVRRRRA